MSSPGPSKNNGSATSSPVQRLLIAVGTLLVIALTVVAAILLAVRDPDSATTTTPTNLPATEVSASLFTPTLLPLPTNLPITEPSPSSTLPPLATATNTLLPPPATNTPLPQPSPPAFTPTPIIVVVTPTPLAATLPPPPPPAGTVGACQAPPEWTAYIVQVGDTLNLLAERTGVSVYDLQQVNCLTNLTIQPGQSVYLPFTPPTPTVTSTNTPVTPSPTATLTGTPSATPRAPEIFTAEPSVDRATIFVVGRNFQVEESGFRVELRGTSGITRLVLGELRSSTSFEAKLPPEAELPDGDYDLRVINSDGQFDTQRIALR